MLAPQYLIARKTGTLVLVIKTLGLSDVIARIYDDAGQEIPNSPVKCVETQPGVYSGTVHIDKDGTYLIQWSGDNGNIQETQNLFVVLSLHATTIRIEDEDTGDPFVGLRVMILQYTDSGYTLISETITNQKGEARLHLPEGTFRICLEKPKHIFVTNGFKLTVNYSDEEIPIFIRTKAINIPESGYTPPTGSVNMTVRLIDNQGQPMRFRDILITTLKPIQYQQGAKYIVAEDQIKIQTDSNGCASVALIPKSEVEVAIANTGIIRRFIVPDADFDLFDYFGINDLFDVQNPTYSPARRVT